jgi:hypothetical protein
LTVVHSSVRGQGGIYIWGKSAGTISILPHLINDWQMNLNVKRIFPFAVSLASAAQLVAQTSNPATLIKAGRLLDPRSGNVLSPAAVLIENAKIKGQMHRDSGFAKETPRI